MLEESIEKNKKDLINGNIQDIDMAGRIIDFTRHRIPKS